jgi:hypothetical protein
MGAHPWIYFVPHQPDVRQAMLELREREFQAGRYNPAVPFPDMNTAAPGAQHDSIDEAREDADADGTRSILDMDDVSATPPDPENPAFGVASKLPDAMLQELFNTTQPTRQMVSDLTFMEDIERGTGVYIIVYDRGKPTEICFAGYSFD